MDDAIKGWLYDILNAINEIESYFLPEEYSIDDYKSDLKTKRAVERNIEIIGEAMSRILKYKSDIKISDARKLVDVRNRIIHGYDSVSDEIMWSIVINNIPLLNSEVEILLGEN